MYGDFGNTLDTVACVLRGPSWRTSTNYIRAPEYNRWSRDKILGELSAFGRLRGSAYSSYWHGRIFHAYLSATILNLRQRKFFTAVERMIYGLTGLVLSGRHILSAPFWQALKEHQVTNTLLE